LRARPGPWRTIEDVELATLSWVHWYNIKRLHSYLNDVPPAEYENVYDAERRAKLPVGTP
jgi:putative transposase